MKRWQKALLDAVIEGELNPFWLRYVALQYEPEFRELLAHPVMRRVGRVEREIQRVVHDYRKRRGA